MGLAELIRALTHTSPLIALTVLGALPIVGGPPFAVRALGQHSDMRKGRITGAHILRERRPERKCLCILESTRWRPRAAWPGEIAEHRRYGREEQAEKLRAKLERLRELSYSLCDSICQFTSVYRAREISLLMGNPPSTRGLQSPLLYH